MTVLPDKSSPLFLLLPLLFVSVARPAEMPSGESLLQISLQKSGGAEAFAKARNAVLTGKVEMAGHNIGGPVEIYQEDGKSYTAIDLPGIGKVEEGFDGETAWEMNSLQGARVKDGEERAAVIRASRMSVLDTWRDFYSAATTVGSEDVDGKPAWKVEMTPKEGKPEIFYFDKQSMLLVRTTAHIATALGEIPVDTRLGDYRPVDGIQTPFSMTQNAMTQTLVMKFDKVQYNASIPPGRFDLPAAVKAIAQRQK
ncbi:MAG TPA: hypothetical protein VKB79_17470 [Bryobacteraceae bacterium]|nr:hypothetical protein [Bryobacteraceae bacterium]